MDAPAMTMQVGRPVLPAYVMRASCDTSARPRRKDAGALSARLTAAEHPTLRHDDVTNVACRSTPSASYPVLRAASAQAINRGCSTAASPVCSCSASFWRGESPGAFSRSRWVPRRRRKGANVQCSVMSDAFGLFTGNGRGAGTFDNAWISPALELPPMHVHAPGQRVIAVGDLHGDFEVTKAALRLGGVLSLPNDSKVRGGYDDNLQWVGGDAIVVQVGDILDRGGDEIAILSLLRHLDSQAIAAGGRVFQINGNHETLNVATEFRYVTEEGFRESEAFFNHCLDDCNGNWDLAFRDWWRTWQEMKRQRAQQEHMGWNTWNPLVMRRLSKIRTEIFEVGSPIAKELSRHGVSIIINDTLFAHGGVLPHHVDYGLERINREVCRWMRGDLGEYGEREPMPFIATRGFDSVVWNRLYSQEFYASPDDRFMACTVLSSALDSLGVERLVVGHTPQMLGANSACGGRVWRIDVGMSSGMLSASPQVLEIIGDQARVLGRDSVESLQPDPATAG